MLVNQCLSLLLSFAISVNTTAAWVKNTEYIEPEPVVNYITEEVIDEPIVEEPIIEEVEEELPLSNEDIDLIALVTMAEAEGESEEGKRLVIDVILNRFDSDRFPNTISGVVYARNAFECMWNGRVDRCYVRDDIRQLVIEELKSRTYSNTHYFRTNHYHNFGIPVVQVGNHYFSTY
jgi:N-acetylmuramoyl-L-alanine amidase